MEAAPMFDAVHFAVAAGAGIVLKPLAMPLLPVAAAWMYLVQ
ncbi:MAG: hypothetical protein ACQEXJ_12950 [Myxococcota bacterium]